MISFESGQALTKTKFILELLGSRNLLQKRKMLEMRVGGVMCRLESGDLNINSLFSLRTHQS